MNRRIRWAPLGAALVSLSWTMLAAQADDRLAAIPTATGTGPARVVVSDLPTPPQDNRPEFNVPGLPPLTQPQAAESMPEEEESDEAGDEYISANAEALDLYADAPAGAAKPAPKCDAKKKAALKKAVGGAYKGVFYDNKFDYLNDPCYTGHNFGENFKRMCILDGALGVMDIGGQYRARYMGESNMRGSGLTGRDDNFLLHRTRLYSNWELNDRLRVFGEFIDAESNYERFTPRAIEVNRSDIQNLFADAKVFDGTDGDLFLRYGRQELLFGNQRVISPLDWANTRRTFEGVKGFWRGKDWDVDAFWTRPMITNPYRFDNVDDSQEFQGVYASYKALKDEKLDLYTTRHLKTKGANPFNNTTMGAAYNGTQDAWLWDLEGAYQFGQFNGNSHQSGFWVAGLGRKMDDLKWKPVLWGYYDWARGDTPPGNAYDQQFPLVHKYNGFMDLFGRRNLEDANFQLIMKPSEKLTLLAWQHFMWRQNINDVVYNANNTVFVNDPSGGKYLGSELDLLATYAIHPRHEAQFGYSHFWSGTFYKTNASVPYRRDANFFYAQYQFNF